MVIHARDELASVWDLLHVLGKKNGQNIENQQFFNKIFLKCELRKGNSPITSQDHQNCLPVKITLMYELHDAHKMIFSTDK